MSSLINFLKNLPIDLGQAQMREKTKGKQIALSLVPPGEGKTALDIGCREGKQSEWLKTRSYMVEPLDIEPKYKEGKKVDVNNGLPYKDNTFDLIWCSEVLEHLDNPAEAVQEMRRVLKDKGQLIITVPNSNFWFYHFLKPFGLTPQQLQNCDHKHFFSISKLKIIFSNATFYGYFPYAFIKFTLENETAINLLSPTFVIHENRIS